MAKQHPDYSSFLTPLAHSLAEGSASQSFKMSRFEQAGAILMEPRRLKDLASRGRENGFLFRRGSFGMTAGRIPQTETLICLGPKAEH
jgi:hypothetical protein